MKNLVNINFDRQLRLFAGWAFITGLFLVSSCDNNKILKQASVDNAIKEFVSTHDAPGTEDYKGTFDDSSIKAIEPLKQYSKTEAAAIAHLSYKNDRMSHFPIELKLVFIFRKTLDNKWVLTAFENTKDFGGLYTNDNGHINIRAQ